MFGNYLIYSRDGDKRKDVVKHVNPSDENQTKCTIKFSDDREIETTNDYRKHANEVDIEVIPMPTDDYLEESLSISRDYPLQTLLGSLHYEKIFGGGTRD